MSGIILVLIVGARDARDSVRSGVAPLSEKLQAVNWNSDTDTVDDG